MVKMSEQPRPTETDRLLLPLAVSSHKADSRDDGGANADGSSGRRRHPYRLASVIGGSAILLAAAAAAVVALGALSLPSSRGNGNDDDDVVLPKAQRAKLQLSTEHALLSILPNDTLARIYRQSSSSSSHPMGKLHEITDPSQHGGGRHGGGDDGDNDDDRDGMLRCTSQVMIMRHCDKEVEVNVRGHHVTTDEHDSVGNRHCSATGRARSEYIATLFVDPDEYQKLVKDEKTRGKIGGVPPVPMVKSTLKSVSKFASSKKPQFPTPLKLYALAVERDGRSPGSKGGGKGGKGKIHKNYREIETITPLSRKFHLGVDERFGVGDEDDLASDYFGELGKSVTEKYRGRMMNGLEEGGGGNKNDHHRNHGGGGGGSGPGEEARLCHRGMTVVNWKHSRIPELARALGCGSAQGCPRKYDSEDFDTVWLITFQYTLMLGSALPPGGEELESSSMLGSLGSIHPSSSASSGSSSIGIRPGGGGGGGGRSLRSLSSGSFGTWKIEAKMVNEGFYPV